MDKWEYMIIAPPGFSLKKFEQRLNELGQQGWELVCVDLNYCYLKRKAQS